MKNPKKKPIKFIPFLLICLILFVSFLTISLSLLRAVDKNDNSIVTFVIPRGQSTQKIAKNLHEKGLIRSPLAFRLIVLQQGLQNKIQAGSFKLTPSLSTIELAHLLTKGTDDVWITIPEGWRREEIAVSLVNQDLSNFNEEEFLDLTIGLEGQLFPETYLVSKASSSQTIVHLLHNTFENKALSLIKEHLQDSNLTVEQVLTLASLVQRESAHDAEMPLVAGILFNRLEINMALQVDATLQYIKAFSTAEQNWWATPTAADKKLASAYNTYLNPGLPPAPICNPGLAAIEAVLNPQSSNALYYIHDLSGQIHTAETLEAHNANVNQYLR